MRPVWLLAATVLAAGWAAPGAAPAQKAAGSGPIIVLDTAKGVIEIETFPKEAPQTVERVLTLVKKNFYNGLRFHRVEPKFVVQVGDPVSRDMSREAWWGRNPGTGKPIGVAEINKKRRHVVGSVGMAHAGDPGMADSQFYIIIEPRPGLDGKFVVFGQVISGMDVVRTLQRADMLKKASVKE